MTNFTDKEFIEYYYTHTMPECCKHFHISKKTFYELKNKLNLQKSKDQIYELRKQTNLEKYGVEHPSQTAVAREKASENYYKSNLQRQETINSNPNFWKDRNNKSFQTKEMKYGDKNYNNRDKATQTYIEKYGTTAYTLTEEFIKKSKQTRIDNYGSLENSYIEGRKKCVETNLEKYGVETPYSFGSPEFRENMKRKYGDKYISKTDYWRDKTQETCVEKYGVNWACQTDQCIAASNSKDSKPNLLFEELLKDNNIPYTREFTLGDYRYDFKVGDNLIEINPTITHNSTFNPYSRNVSKDYHFDKTNLARDNNLTCINIWDWDDMNKIISYILPKEKIYARNCSIKSVDIKLVNEFLESYHFQGTCKGQDICLGLFYNDELVQLMTFGKPRYTKKYDYELLRLCSIDNKVVIGGASKLFKYFIENYNPSSIISYCDMSKFNGEIYNSLGFSLKEAYKPSKHWYNIKTNTHITDNLLRKRGYDQLFKTNYGKGTSNEVLMLENNFVEVYDAGQATFIWTSNNLNED